MDNDIWIKKKLSSLHRNLKFKWDYRKYKVGTEEKGNQEIFEALSTNEPLMIARLGATETMSIKHYFSGEDYPSDILSRGHEMAGIFPETKEGFSEFCEIYLEATNNVDIMALVAVPLEKFIIDNNCPNASLIKWRSLEPYYFSNPWSRILKNKRVLVINSFENSIRNQYLKREMLFENKNILPEFKSLSCMKSVVSNAGATPPYKSWGEAYRYMCDEIAKYEYDIALIGAGAYSLPLASFVKNQGKQAIQMSGSTQILFGIKGKRWDNHPFISKLYNGYWVRPDKSETPIGKNKVEGGSYW